MQFLVFMTMLDLLLESWCSSIYLR